MGIVAGGVVEVLLIGWFFKPEKIRKIANDTSNFSIGKWWTWCLKFVTVIVLGYTFITNIITYFKDGYEGYPMWAGYMILAFLALGVIVITSIKGKPGFYRVPEDAPQWEPVGFYSKLAIGCIIVVAILVTITQIVAAAGGSTGMSTGGNVMMLIACVGLWGGIALALIIMQKHNKVAAAEKQEAIGETEPAAGAES